MIQKPLPTIDIRCPKHPPRLLLKVTKPQVLDGQNLLEVSCRDCRNDLRAARQKVIRVIHRFTTDGQHVNTIVIEGKN